jgi:hypothetical protein
MKISKVVFTNGQNVFVISLSKTSNKKITDGTKIVQTYTFSREQWALANNGTKIGMKEFFKLDAANCLDCPFSGNSGNGKCYTHKLMQYSGFLSSLRSINVDQLTPLNAEKTTQIIEMSAGKYVRFGTYGEPSLLPIQLVASVCNVAKNWTGYTHQHEKSFAAEFSKYFMASIENEEEKLGWRSFRVLTEQTSAGAVVCPASNEAGFKSNCATCGLCSGLLGKGKKDVQIVQH